MRKDEKDGNLRRPRKRRGWCRRGPGAVLARRREFVPGELCWVAPAVQCAPGEARLRDCPNTLPRSTYRSENLLKRYSKAALGGGAIVLFCAGLAFGANSRALVYDHSSPKARVGLGPASELDANATGWANGVSGTGKSATGMFLVAEELSVEQSAGGTVRIDSQSSADPGQWTAALQLSGAGSVSARASKGGFAEAVDIHKLHVTGHLYGILHRKADVDISVPLTLDGPSDMSTDTWSNSIVCANSGYGSFYSNCSSRAKGSVKVRAVDWSSPVEDATAAILEYLGLDVEPDDTFFALYLQQSILGLTTAWANGTAEARLTVQFSVLNKYSVYKIGGPRGQSTGETDSSTPTFPTHPPTGTPEDGEVLPSPLPIPAVPPGAPPTGGPMDQDIPGVTGQPNDDPNTPHDDD